MNIRTIFVTVALTGLLAACGATPEQKKAHAETEYTQEKTKTLVEYKECVKDAGEDKAKLDTCDRLLKAVEAVEPENKP